MSELPNRKHTDVMRALLPLAGRAVVEVGCGGGALLRFMAHLGASPAIGIDPNAGVLARAHKDQRQADEIYAVGQAQALPIATAAVDAVVYANALHHVPLEDMRPALSEAARVLKPDGQLYVTEPIADGDFFRLTRAIEDETEVRQAALDALHEAAASPDFDLAQEVTYVAPVSLPDFPAYLQRMIDAAPERADRVRELEDTLRAGFEATAEVRDGAYWFEQPSRLTLLKRC